MTMGTPTPVPIFAETLGPEPDDDVAELPEVARAAELVDVPDDVVTELPEVMETAPLIEFNGPEVKVTSSVCGDGVKTEVTRIGTFDVS